MHQRALPEVLAALLVAKSTTITTGSGVKGKVFHLKRGSKWQSKGEKGFRLR